MKFNEKIFEELKPILKGKNFDESLYFPHNGGLEYFRKTTENLHWISVDMGITNKGLVNIYGRISFFSVLEILQKFIDFNKKILFEEIVQNYYYHQNKELATQLYKSFGAIPLKTKQDIEDFKQYISNHVDTYILPFCEKIPNLQAVNDEILDKVPQAEYTKYIPGKTNFKVLIIMRLCNNSKYNDFKNWCISAYKKGFDENPERYGKDYETLQSLIAYLDSGEYKKDII